MAGEIFTRLAVDNVPRWYALGDVSRAVDHAIEKHGSESWSRHEFYAILLEEVDEMWDAIKGDRPTDEMLAEAVQVAAMVIRYIETSRDRDESNYG